MPILEILCQSHVVYDVRHLHIRERFHFCIFPIEVNRESQFMNKLLFTMGDHYSQAKKDQLNTILSFEGHLYFML